MLRDAPLRLKQGTRAIWQWSSFVAGVMALAVYDISGISLVIKGVTYFCRPGAHAAGSHR